MILVGAVTMALSTFLPLDEPTGLFRTVRDNTLIQSGGWLLIALAIGIAAAGFRASQKPEEWIAPVVVCVVAGGRVIFWFLDKSLRTLYPIGADGTPDTSQPGTVAALGIALYVAGAGVAIALVGSLMLCDSGTDGLPTQAQKKCPDCAETILADARMCKHLRIPLRRQRAQRGAAGRAPACVGELLQMPALAVGSSGAADLHLRTMRRAAADERLARTTNARRPC
jgi:hypothetical protein